MLRRYLEQDEAIGTTLCLLNRSDLLIASDKTTVLKEAVDTLQPFEAVTTELSLEKYVCFKKYTISKITYDGIQPKNKQAVKPIK
uniref:Uncharacterized protein n=1 Tax=Amphimedon queenslandica TaxID=400682 RepID=A0A1X7VW65_AMPQE